jgi:hypothetical protein
MSVSKVYSIFLKNECVLQNLTPEKFESHWEMLNNLVGILKTDYTTDDLSYKESISE